MPPERGKMTRQDLKECIAEVKHSGIPERSKKMIMNVLYEQKPDDGDGEKDGD